MNRRKIITVLNALPTKLMLIATALSYVVDAIVPLLADGTAQIVTAVAAKVLVAIAAGIAVLRRVTPVIRELVGIEMPAGARIIQHAPQLPPPRQ